MDNGKFVIGIDTGGTFTDAVVIQETGEMVTCKAPTTPEDFSKGVMDVLKVAAAETGLEVGGLLSRTSMIKHGTTVATNALIQRRGARVGFITTRGFEDTTIIMRGIGRVAGLSEDEIKHMTAAVKPIPLVPKQRIKGVTERIDFRGNIVIPLNVGEAREAIRSLIDDEQVEALAVSFLFGFVNPVHENKIADLAKEMYPEREIPVVLASKLVPVVREYARDNTVIMEAFLGAEVTKYFAGLANKLTDAGYKRQILLMQGNGGITYEHEMSAIGIVESGPAAGILGSKVMGDAVGESMIICTDMGGTSFDVGLITNGEWEYARDPVVERFHVTWPIIDIESIGAGGGTIATFDRIANTILVGPRSAEAVPGPVCYDIGGTEPTVTDADLVLGMLNPEYFLGGRMRLNNEKAKQAIEEKIARPMGMSVIEAAAGIHQIVNAHMADLIRKRLIRRGYLTEQYVIYAYGGASGVHAAGYSRPLGVKRISFPSTGPVFSASGAALADLVHSRIVSYRVEMPVDKRSLNDKLALVEEELLDVLKKEGCEKKDVEFRRTFHMRYKKQLNEVPVVVPTKKYDDNDIITIMDLFEQRYEEIYGTGTSYRVAGIEILYMTVDAVGKIEKPELLSQEIAGSDASKALKTTRQVYFPAEMRQFVEANIYDLNKLTPGNMVNGPSIIEGPLTTIVVLPELACTMDEYRNLVLTL